jgi:hypothetical protein
MPRRHTYYEVVRKIRQRLEEDHSAYAPRLTPLLRPVTWASWAEESETERVLVRDERELLRHNRSLRMLEAKPLPPPGK